MEELIKITASYGQDGKVSKDFQSKGKSYFASLTETLPAGTSVEAQNEAYRALFMRCKVLVLEQVGEGSEGGLEAKMWRETLDNYLLGRGTLSTEDWAAMSDFQQAVFQEIKKHNNRTKVA